LYSLINAISASLQFVVLPLTMKRIEPKLVWRFMPIIPFACSVITSLEENPSLYLLALRAVVNEMVRGYFVVVCVYNECKQ
jgi:hypothetical protein